MRMLFLPFIAFLFLVCGSVTAQNLETISFNGQNRTMLVYAPANIPANRPLVISLHGANQDADYQKNQTNWNNCADTAKFVVVYPNAINKFWDTSGDNDVKFIEHIMDLMYDRYQIDRTRIYLSGFSLGAMMTYVCIDKLYEKVAAFAPVSGVRFDNKYPAFTRRVPIIHSHGTGDDVFKWTGDLAHSAGGYPYIPDYVKECANLMGLTTETTIKPYPTTKSNSAAWLKKWTKAGDPIEVWLLALEGKGHWHSEDINGSVSTTQEIWKFFCKYALAPSIVPEYENNSFDLPSDIKSFYFDYTSSADFSITKCTYLKDDISVEMEKQLSENRVTFSFPADFTVPEGTCQLKLTNVRDGGKRKTLIYNYTIGFTDISDEANPDTTSTAYIYKGKFLRMMERAWYVYNNTGHLKASRLALRKKLKTAIDKYDGLTSTSPSVYEAAMQELEALILTVEPYVDEATAISNLQRQATPTKIRYFTTSGSQLSSPRNGLNIVKTTLNNKTVTTKKVVIN